MCILCVSEWISTCCALCVCLCLRVCVTDWILTFCEPVKVTPRTNSAQSWFFLRLKLYSSEINEFSPNTNTTRRNPPTGQKVTLPSQALGKPVRLKALANWSIRHHSATRCSGGKNQLQNEWTAPALIACEDMATHLIWFSRPTWETAFATPNPDGCVRVCVC